MKNLKLKEKVKFEAFQVTGFPDQFSAIKQFCGGDRVHISYETCSVDDYWSIELEDDLKDTKVVVPNNSYILKIIHDDNKKDYLLTVKSGYEIKEYFDVVEEK